MLVVLEVLKVLEEVVGVVGVGGAGLRVRLALRDVLHPGGTRRGLPAPSELRNNDVVKKRSERTGAAAAGRAAAREAVATGRDQTPQGAEEQSGTRQRVARSILHHGPSTAAELAGRLGLTQAAVRRHLDALAAEGLVEPREKRVHGSRGRGRPAKAFALTDAGRGAFDQAYDELAVEALRWIERAAGGGEGGAAAVMAFARERAEAQAELYRPFLQDAPAEGRARALAEALTHHGYAAAIRGVASPAGEQLCQHHCPVAHAAARFPQLCEAETEVFSRLLGSHVQRLATIAHGDGVCTTFVPKATVPGAARAAKPSRGTKAGRTAAAKTAAPTAPKARRATASAATAEAAPGSAPGPARERPRGPTGSPGHGPGPGTAPEGGAGRIRGRPAEPPASVKKTTAHARIAGRNPA